jgi:GntR family transcriptional regulator
MTDEPALGFRPLYRQVRDVLVRRIADGTWQGGQGIPSEAEIAADLKVSPGTVRKALDEMAAERLLVRRQGRGTTVSRHDDDRVMFQFFKLMPDEGERRFPESRSLSVATRPAAEEARAALGLGPDALVLRLERLRSLSGETCILEEIQLPAALFPGLEGRELPNNLYQLYADEFGITVARASERLKAVAATKALGRHLKLREGSPLLRIERTAFALDGRPVEWRVSLCDTARAHYLSDLR